jgi:hypothetical protein
MSEGICCICGKISELTFEHVPPKASFNDKPIYIYNHDNLYESSSKYYGKRSKSNKGLGSNTLCRSCNSLTGTWYVNAFADFAKQGKTIINNHSKGTYLIVGDYRIKPINVLKQIICMHLSADKSGSLRNIQDLKEFILTPESQNAPKNVRLFLYSNLSNIKRFFGYTIITQNDSFGVWSEINFQPFGYFLTINSEPPQKDMYEITNFNEYRFDEEVIITLRTPYLEVQNNLIGDYYYPNNI